jgi:hypothetical protein
MEGPSRPVRRGSSLSHYFAFTGYMAIPALGPRFALAPMYRTDLTGLLAAEPIRHFLDGLKESNATPSQAVTSPRR